MTANRALRVNLLYNPDKGAPFADALTKAGHDLVNGPGDVTLIDADLPTDPYRSALALDQPALIYPHGPGLITHNDGIWRVHPRVEANFVIGSGVAEAMLAMGYPIPLIVIGWPFVEQRPFAPTAGRRVLFAPTHPDPLGYNSTDRKQATAAVLDRLVEAGFDVTVRHLGSMRSNGLRYIEGVEYHQAGVVGAVSRTMVEDIDAADVVISTSSFAFNAVARGKPVVWYLGRDWEQYWRYPGQPLVTRTWPRYAELLRYPYEAEAPDLARTVARACAGGPELDEWRQRFIGEPFDGPRFAADVERLVANSTGSIGGRSYR
ncbi:MAG: hypothetical protein AB7N61_23945 [Acidimicrobiia bacterium]